MDEHTEDTIEVFDPDVEYSDEEGEMDYAATLAFTQKMRRRLVAKQTKGGQSVPGDKEGIEVLLKTLKDIDGTAIADRRNTIDEGNADTARNVADSMAAFIAQNQNPFIRQPDGFVAPAPTVNRDRLPQVEHVDGETFIGIVAESEEMFTKRMQGEYEAELDADDEE